MTVLERSRIAQRRDGGPARRSAPSAVRSALAFDALGGPLVAVCGVTGGTGTTTLAWLLAQSAARASAAPVLLAELPPASGGLAALAGIPATRSLRRLLDTGAEGAFAPVGGPDGLRVVASGPEPPMGDRHAELAALLTALQAEHGLVVLDCGVLQAPDAQAAVARATHVVWTVPSGPAGAERARALLLDGPFAPPPGTAREVLAVAATRRFALPFGSDRTLREIAAERCERLVLIPHEPALAGGRLRPASGRLAGACAAIAGVLHQPASEPRLVRRTDT